MKDRRSCVTIGRVGNSLLCGVLAVGLVVLCLSSPPGVGAAQGDRGATGEGAQGRRVVKGQDPAKFVILFLVEGVEQRSLKTGPMPNLNRLAADGAVTWSAQNPTPTLRLPTVASILTGLPMDKHGITWDEFDFARGYPRAPSVFDYIDVSGGRDTAVFFMDESLYQLARPEPYIDYQVCGPLRPECSSDTLLRYIRDYMIKGASGEGYGRRILSLPHLLVVHLPEAAWAGQRSGWDSTAHRQALQKVDGAIGGVLTIYRDLGLLDDTTMFVMSLNGEGETVSPKNGKAGTNVMWIASGHGIKAGHTIEEPVFLMDTGATVMRTFGLETYTEWESRPIDEVFAGSGAVAARGPAGRVSHGR